MKTPFAAVRAALAVTVLASLPALGQIGGEMQTTRGRIWETMANDGFLSSLDDWDYLTYKPFGLFPGFLGFVHPVGNENLAVNTFANANMHHFRGGVWLVTKDFMTAGQPPTYLLTKDDYEIYISGAQQDAFGGEDVLQPMVKTTNYIEKSGFNPLLPEEMITATWNTCLGITVTRRSYVWSYPGYRDFIIYDYIFKNTGKVVSNITRQILPDTVLAKINGPVTGVYFASHSGISVSTKSQINFHSNIDGIQAGAFGWNKEYYHDFYRIFDNGELVFSLNYNGGWQPPPFDINTKPWSEWQIRFPHELQSPAAFGWLALYASPTTGTPRATPKPDILRIDTHKGGRFMNRNLDLETFVPKSNPRSKFYDFVTTPDTQAVLGNNGNRFNFYTLTYGPYTIPLGDSVRVIVAEIAGVMDMNDVVAGETSKFPDSSIAAIRRNADFARNAVKWGLGATVAGVPLAADAPEPPPGPVCDAVNASFGTEDPKIAVVWEKNAETATFNDGSGNVFYNGATDLDGYRIYKSVDFQYSSAGAPRSFRGEAWTLLKDIPISQAANYFDAGIGKYKLVDSVVVFGERYGYYVAGYRLANPARSWTSANGSVLNGLPEMESGSYNKTLPASALPGPVPTMDIFVAPNPYVFGDAKRSFGDVKIEFRNLPEIATIRIYTISGDLVRTLEHAPDARGNVYGSEPWDLKTTSGLDAAPGLYVYHVESKTPGVNGSLTGKLMIIR